MKARRILISIILFIFFFPPMVFGQDLLSRNITLEVKSQRLDHVLEILSNKADFYFSYNSTSIKRDSLVSLSVQNLPLREVLSQLFSSGYEFRQSGRYIIIRRAPIRMIMITKKAVAEEKYYLLSGYVYDELSGYGIHDASVYDKRWLISSLTNQDGFFRLKMKSKGEKTIELSISKEFYQDTSIQIETRRDQELMITLLPLEAPADRVIIRPEDYLVPAVQRDTVVAIAPRIPIIADTVSVEKTRMGRFFLSGKQKIQTINLRKFFTTRPFQISVIPGIGTQGKMSGQVVNNFSLNIFGGYTAGTKGLEIGGLFNIDKKEVKYVQVGGLFNVVGGRTTGLQIGGLNNTVLDTVSGFQVAGLNNIVKGKFSGFQIAGIYNHVTDSVKGFQLGGVANFAKKKVSGVQFAGVMNFSNREMSGVQIAGVVNYTKKLNGVQFGLINIAGESEGYSIGLINIILKGYHKLSLFSNETIDANAAFKTGNRKLYNILLAGYNTKQDKKAFTFGYGLGTEQYLNKKKTFSLNPELTSQYLYLGSWDYTNIQNKLQLHLQYSFGKFFSIFAGPSYSVLISDQSTAVNGYLFPVPPSGYNVHSFSNRVSGWLGWNAGINFF